MGSIHVNGIDDEDQQEMGSIDTLSEVQAGGDHCRSSKIIGLASDQSLSQTGMRDEILLLSWLIVLLRIQDGDHISYEWAYKHQFNDLRHQPKKGRLLMNEVLAGLQNNVSEAAAAISRYITTVAPSRRASASHPASLLLSTSSLSQISDKIKDGGVLHLEARLDNGRLVIRPIWHSETMPPFTVTRYVETLVDMVRICIANPDASINDCIRPTARDLDEIWGWNHLLPRTYNFCMHDLISERSRRSPGKVAVSSWDGTLTYAQIDRYSTFLANSLKKRDIKFHDFVPVCLEKSRWTIVAILSVMKAGATFVLMDPTLPLARLQNMAEQVGAKNMLTSRKQHDLSSSILPEGKLLVVEADTFTHMSTSCDIPKLAAVPPSTLMYIIFTSGSTGTPKGVQISHQTYTSSAMPRAKAVGYTENSRVLDFASYAFDVSIDSMLLTLGNGGCLCIPSDEDRLNDINGVIRRMQVNYAGLTPSVARILDPDVVASLSALGLGGEAASARDVTLWGQDTRIVIGYGPCECTIGCTVNGSAASGRDYISIGTGNGAAIWVINPNDHNCLMPVGAVGELLVEGPIVGQGYLNDPEKTAAAFINDPAWLIAGHNGYPGRRGRLYKTGDLGKYDLDGSGGIVFVGRKDTQVKLRGQRVELGEIESQLKARLPSDVTVIAEVIVPLGSGSQPTLVAFVASQSTNSHDSSELKSVQHPSELRRVLSEADTAIAEVLPRYMVPTAYIPVNRIPTLISGKTDRKSLRQFATTVDLRQLDQGTASTTTRQLNDMELRLRQVWCQTLKLEADSVRPDDNFFALGGDSLTAMRLVSVCREHGLDLTVINTFSHPTLSAMAGVVLISNSESQMKTPAFSMISQSVESARLEASRVCGTISMAVEDIYLCTPTQESLFTFSLKSRETYVAQRVACIPSHINLDVWKNAWESVVAANPILRTRLAQLQGPGLQQVVLKETISWRHSTNLTEYLENDRNERMELGQSLARYAIVTQPNDDKRYMVWTVHHVLYDGWSEPLILKHVSNTLQGQSIGTQAEIRDFVKYVCDTDEVAMGEFWRQELGGAVGPQFPRLPSRDYLPTPDAMLEHHVPFKAPAGSTFTMATLIRGAWALVASQYTRSDDVVFGETLTGRDISLPGVESIVGPLIATVPIRIHVHRTSSVESYLQAIQQSMLARTPYQHMGMQNIRKVSRDAQYACEAGTGLVIQPESEAVCSELGFENGDVVREALHFNPYPLMIACGIQKGGFRVCANFDSSLVEVTQMQRILKQLEVACLQLTKNLSKRVGEISCMPEVELAQIWRWNQFPPLSFDESSRRLRADASVKQGAAYPRAVIDWVCDPRNSTLLSPIGCVGELFLESAILSGDSIESPAWLVAGSSDCVGRKGRVQSTGDLVQLRDDGSLIFVGRKEDMSLVHGHPVDIADLEAHFTRQLPCTIRSAAAVLKPSQDSTEQPLEHELVAFIEQQPSEEETVELLPKKHDIKCDGSDPQNFCMSICASIPMSLAVALKKLDKFIQDSLPSYMIPSAYIVVDKIPARIGHVDHSSLNQLASQIPGHLLTQLRESFKGVWTKILSDANLTPTETVLQSSWAKILRLKPEQIDLDDNFFRLGGDSVLAMKLVSSLYEQGHKLTVADIFQHMRLRDAARVLKLNYVTKRKTKSYQPFSTLHHLDIKDSLSQVVQPKLFDPSWTVQDMMPVTDSQALDVKATVHAPRTSVQYTMLYLDKDIDQERLFRACKDIIKSHEILRTVFIEHETTVFQVVLDQLNIPIIRLQADGDLEQYVTDLCTKDSESNFSLGSTFLKTTFVEGNEAQDCLIIRLSHAQYDGVSLPALLRDLEFLYTGGRIADPEPFSSYIARIHDDNANTASLNYWKTLLHGSSLSVLRGPSVQQPTDKSIFHTRPVDISQRFSEITTANLLTAAWALVLARCLQTRDVTFGGITSGRTVADLANASTIVGPCYQFTPIRVPFRPTWTGLDLLRFVQNQTAESAAHDYLGFDKICQRCTNWSSSSSTSSSSAPQPLFFDSIVHHQDFEDFDTMPFAGGTTRVDNLNPHGDAAYPLKAVSFVRPSGEARVGIVGGETDPAFVHALVDELAAAVAELAVSRPESVRLAV